MAKNQLKNQPKNQLNEAPTSVKLISDSEWDFYSGLPNPEWYDNSDDQTESDEG